jgi:hypothetical protein
MARTTGQAASRAVAANLTGRQLKTPKGTGTKTVMRDAA